MALKRILRQLQKNNSRLESLRAAMCEKSEHGKVSGATAEHKPQKTVLSFTQVIIYLLNQSI